MMRVWITGASGQLGRMLQLLLLRTTNDLVMTDVFTGVHTGKLDITDPEAAMAFMECWHPGAIINAAAYTNVDHAEDQRELALDVNCEGPKVLAGLAKEFGSTLIHFSTDYVFNGRKGSPYVETDDPDPLNFYGLSKLAGEREVEKSGCDHYIFRLQALYSPLGRNFVRTMVDKGKTEPVVRVVSDQTITSTYAMDVAWVIDEVIGLVEKRKAPEHGTYHLANRGEHTWYQLARRAITRTNGTAKVKPWTFEEYRAGKRIADRPMYSAFDCTKLETALGHKLRTWRSALDDCARAIIAG